MHRFIAVGILVLFCGFGTAGFAADDWVEKVVAETDGLLTGRCVSPSSPNSVYVLNATSGEHMLPEDERRAVNDLTSALRAKGWMQVIHGSALPKEAYTRENNPEGRQQMYDLLTRLSDATVTIFVVPLRRAGNAVQAEVVYLARGIDNGATHLTCAYGINVDIPVTIIEGTGIDDFLGPRQSICNPRVDTLVVRNVTEYATFRSGTSYDAPVVAQARLGASVDYTGSRRLAKPSKAKRCDQLCRSEIAGTLDGSDRSAFARCIEDDVFWLNVRTAGGEVGWMSAKYLRLPQSDPGPERYPPTGVENGCEVIPRANNNDLDAAEAFVALYYADLSARRLRCAEKRWLDPPGDLGEMIVEFVSARLSFNKLDRARSDRNRALVDVVAHVKTTDGARTAWRVTLTLVPSRAGWLIEEMDGYQM